MRTFWPTAVACRDRTQNTPLCVGCWYECKNRNVRWMCLMVPSLPECGPAVIFTRSPRFNWCHCASMAAACALRHRRKCTKAPDTHRDTETQRHAYTQTQTQRQTQTPTQAQVTKPAQTTRAPPQSMTHVAALRLPRRAMGRTLRVVPKRSRTSSSVRPTPTTMPMSSGPISTRSYSS